MCAPLKSDWARGGNAGVGKWGLWRVSDQQETRTGVLGSEGCKPGMRGGHSRRCPAAAQRMLQQRIVRAVQLCHDLGAAQPSLLGGEAKQEGAAQPQHSALRQRSIGTLQLRCDLDIAQRPRGTSLCRETCRKQVLHACAQGERTITAASGLSSAPAAGHRCCAARRCAANAVTSAAAALHTGGSTPYQGTMRSVHGAFEPLFCEAQPPCLHNQPCGAPRS